MRDDERQPPGEGRDGTEEPIERRLVLDHIARAAPPPASVRRSCGRPEKLKFEDTPPPGGYLWWYADGLSEDHRFGFSVIVFVGSVFSPYYAWSGRRAPENHVSVNVALYGPGWSRWAMTERGRRALHREADGVAIGDSAVRWRDDALRIDIDETSVPHLQRLRGAITLRPGAVYDEVYDLDSGGRQHWRPVAPAAAVDVDFGRPDFKWRGSGYFDMNWGEEPLERGFHRWDWSRAPTRAGGAAVLYDAHRRDGTDLSLALRFDGRGGVDRVDPPRRYALPKTLWRLERAAQADPDASPFEARRFEDAPFYARSELRSRLFGEPVIAMHESLDADRFSRGWVKRLLPFRMPRAFWSATPGEPG